MFLLHSVVGMKVTETLAFSVPFSLITVLETSPILKPISLLTTVWSILVVPTHAASFSLAIMSISISGGKYTISKLTGLFVSGLLFVSWDR